MTDAVWDRAFGRRLALARTNAGATQTEVGQHLTLSRSSVANMESGRQAISAKHAALVAQFLGVDVAWLLRGPVPGVAVPGPIPPAEVRHSAAVLDQITAQISLVAAFLHDLADMPTSPEVDTQ